VCPEVLRALRMVNAWHGVQWGDNRCMQQRTLMYSIGGVSLWYLSAGCRYTTRARVGHCLRFRSGYRSSYRASCQGRYDVWGVLR